MATNQEKFDQLVADAAAVRKDAPAVSEQGAFNAGNHQVDQKATGRKVSQFDGPREGWGLHSPIDWKGFDGKTPEQGRNTTTLATDIAYNDTRNAVINRKLDTVIETLKALALATGATIDYDEIARKVNDEADRRDRARLEVTTTNEES